MALFSEYAKPGVYVKDSIVAGGVPLFGATRIPVLIGEGQETRAFKAVSIHRGSSSRKDEISVRENLSDQVTGINRVFQLGFYPVVIGNGQGNITNSPSAVQLFAGEIPIPVSSLDGEKGIVTLAAPPAEKTTLRATYAFKRQDTLIEGEDLTPQVPKFAKATVAGKMVVSTSIPGYQGNKVALSLVEGVGSADVVAISGIGSDNIIVDILKSDLSPRTYGEVVSLLNTGVHTLSSGVLVASLIQDGVASTASVTFEGGEGPSSNKIFKVSQTPIVDGNNGGVTTTDPSKVSVTVDGVSVSVASVDGLNGLVTLATPVLDGSTLSISYYTNKFQDTFDLLPGDNILRLDNVGFAAGRADFIDGVDFVLEKDSRGSRIQWGASASIMAGEAVVGSEAFDGEVISTTLVDERVYLRPAAPVAGKPLDFVLEDVPVDGSGLSRVTSDPSKIQVFAGVNPMDAVSRPALRVVGMDGKARRITLYNPIPNGHKVYVNAYRNTLSDNRFELKVAAPGVTGQGTYFITDSRGFKVPTIKEVPTSHDVYAGVFANAGIIWPNSFSDLKSQAGASPDEIITLTFQDDGYEVEVTPAVSAYNSSAIPGIRFRTYNVGIGPNNVTSLELTASTVGVVDANAVTVVGEAILVDIKRESGDIRSVQDVLNLFEGVTTPLAGEILYDILDASGLGNQAAVAGESFFVGGAAAVYEPYAMHYKVTSSRSDAQLAEDLMGRTGGAQTPTSLNVGAGSVGRDGWLGQTYVDPATNVVFTLVDPRKALDYGYDTLPLSYRFRPGDKLVFQVSTATAYRTSAVPVINVPGVRLRVVSTWNIESGSTAFVNTYNKAGREPLVGEFYYADYTVGKTEQDFQVKMFTNMADLYAEYGAPSAINKLSLGAKLFNMNGGQVVACIQVPKQSDMDEASASSFISAINSLAQPLPGSDRKASVIVPLSTDPVVIQALNRHLMTQSSERLQGEATGFASIAIPSTPGQARALAKALASDRMTVICPGGVLISMDVDGRQVEVAVGGEFVAAAMAGLRLNPAFDVATSLTRKNLVGFSRLVRRYDETTMDLAASDGVTWLVEKSGALQIRHHVTTDMGSVVSSEPTNRDVTDEVKYRLRTNLDQFIARKILSNSTNDIAIAVNATMSTMREQELVENFGDVVVKRDASDPRVIHVSLKFKPVMSLLWLGVDLTVTSQM